MTCPSFPCATRKGRFKPCSSATPATPPCFQGKPGMPTTPAMPRSNWKRNSPVPLPFSGPVAGAIKIRCLVVNCLSPKPTEPISPPASATSSAPRCPNSPPPSNTLTARSRPRSTSFPPQMKSRRTRSPRTALRSPAPNTSSARSRKKAASPAPIPTPSASGL